MNKLDADRFGTGLEKLLKILGMSQSDLSRRTGLTQAAISQFISGKREPTLSSICKILNAIPVSFEILVRK